MNKVAAFTFILSFVFIPQVFAGLLPVDTVATGDEVTIAQGSEGRVIGAGWRVAVEDGVFQKSILAVGADVLLNPSIAKGKIYAFGQDIKLNGVFTKPVAAAGQEITLLPTGEIGSSVWLSGRRVWLKGNMVADGKILAQRVVIEGIVRPRDGKMLDIQTKELEILPGAEIHGDILYRGKTAPRIADGAKILGVLTQDTTSFEDELREKLKKVAFIGKLGSKLMLLVWLLVAGFVVSIFMAPKMRSSTKRVHRAPLKMMGVGLGYLLFVPITAVFLLVSVIGMPVGISMMASYPLAIIMGFSIGVLWLGMLIYQLLFKRLPRRRHQLLGAYLMAMPLVVLVTQLPYVGVVGWLVPLCSGLGAFSWLKWQQMQAGKE